jgi:phosphoadenosine phosphosulfate reductase
LFQGDLRCFHKTVKYGIAIKTYFPETSAVEELLNKGRIVLYESVENRKECCFIRKVAPLTKALKGNSIWITGLRAEQSENK